MAKKQKKVKAVAKKAREFVFWTIKGNVIEGSTSFNKKSVVIRGKAFTEAMKVGKDLKKLREVMRGSDVLRSLDCDRAAQKAGRCVNTHYESIKTLQVKMLGMKKGK